MNIHQAFAFSAASVATVLNVILLFIILRFSSERIGSYKYLLFAYTLNAALYTSCQFGILENWYVPKHRAGYLFFSTVHVFSRSVQTWLVTAFIGFFHMNLFIVCWSFLYRLSIFSQSFFFHSFWKVLLLSIFTLFMEAFTIFDGWLIHPTQNSDEEYSEIILNITGKPIEEVGYIGGAFTYNEAINVNLAIALSVNGATNFCVNVFLVYCWLGIRRRLAEKKRQSTSHRIHYRLYILLTLQSLFPIIFNSTPVIIAFSFSALHIDIGDYLLLCGDCMSFAQIMDPIIICLFVNDYKRAVLKFVLGSKMYLAKIAPTTIVSNSQTRNSQANREQGPGDMQAPEEGLA